MLYLPPALLPLSPFRGCAIEPERVLGGAEDVADGALLRALPPVQDIDPLGDPMRAAQSGVRRQASGDGGVNALRGGGTRGARAGR